MYFVYGFSFASVASVDQRIGAAAHLLSLRQEDTEATMGGSSAIMVILVAVAMRVYLPIARQAYMGW